MSGDKLNNLDTFGFSKTLESNNISNNSDSIVDNTLDNLSKSSNANSLDDAFSVLNEIKEQIETQDKAELPSFIQAKEQGEKGSAIDGDNTNATDNTIDNITPTINSDGTATLDTATVLPLLSTKKVKWFKQLKFVLPILGGLLLILGVISLSYGGMPLTLLDLFRGDPLARDLIVYHRIPRTLAVIIAGLGMSISGLIMQTITNNKYVSPMTAGTLDSARLGKIIAILILPATMLGGVLAHWIQSAISFAVTLGLTFLFVFVIGRIKVKSGALIPLIGLIYGSVIGALATFIALQTDNGLQLLISLLMGNFSLTLSGFYEMIYIAVPFVIIAFVFANWFMVAGMGESTAKNLGLNYRLTVVIGLIIVSVITTSVLMVAGLIPFLGLVIPNLVSIYMGDNIKRTLPVTMFAGAIFLLISDLIARALGELPISLIVGVVGAVLFLVLLIIKRRKGSA